MKKREPKYVYQFECFSEELTLAIGESFTDSDGDTVKVKRFRQEGDMAHLVIQVNKTPEQCLENGKRTPNGLRREDFTKWEATYHNGTRKLNPVMIHDYYKI